MSQHQHQHQQQERCRGVVSIVKGSFGSSSPLALSTMESQQESFPSHCEKSTGKDNDNDENIVLIDDKEEGEEDEQEEIANERNGNDDTRISTTITTQAVLSAEQQPTRKERECAAPVDNARGGHSNTDASTTASEETQKTDERVCDLAQGISAYKNHRKTNESENEQDEETTHDADDNKQPASSSSLSFLNIALPIFIHVFIILLYLIPLTQTSSTATPVLDESHVMSHDNKDVVGASTLYEVFTNDYWGRPMTSPSSHKSWRPFTVLTFRYLKGGGGGGFLGDQLFVHRITNVIIHAAIAEMASITSTLLFPDLTPSQTLCMRCLTKLLFALHPTHVECAANAANRPHLLALLCSTLMVDARVHIGLVMTAQIAGLSACETFVFQLPAVLLTMTVIQWKRQCPKRRQSGNEKGPSVSSLGASVIGLVPRYLLITTLGATYLIGRYAFDTLSIPDGLIRPAENPFYALTGMRRAMNYSYVLSVHALKAFYFDPVGFSHEYGYDCIPEIAGTSDPRLFLPAALIHLAIAVSAWCATGKNGLEATLHFLLLMSWMATLFPVSGFVKVGTFIADRIVVASTFAVAIFAGRWIATWIISSPDADKNEDNGDDEDEKAKMRKQKGVTSSSSCAVSVVIRRVVMSMKIILVAIAMVSLWIKVHVRTTEWMDSYPLLKSSLVTCPRSAKSNLEFSKIFSGLYPEKLDLDFARALLEKAEEIDPDYCDVHQQFAHVAVQQNRVIEFEERLTKAIMCPFTMGGAVEMWRRYWQQVTSDPQTGPYAVERMNKYQRIINEAIERETAKEKSARKKHADKSRRGRMYDEF